MDLLVLSQFQINSHLQTWVGSSLKCVACSQRQVRDWIQCPWWLFFQSGESGILAIKILITYATSHVLDEFGILQCIAEQARIASHLGCSLYLWLEHKWHPWRHATGPLLLMHSVLTCAEQHSASCVECRLDQKWKWKYGHQSRCTLEWYWTMTQPPCHELFCSCGFR